MKRLVCNPVLGVMFGFVFVLGAQKHTDVSLAKAKGMVDSNAGLIVVDVREYDDEYCELGHIPGALNYPLRSGVLEKRYAELPVDGEILVVCRSGGRSNEASEFLDSKEYSYVFDMTGGMNSWQWEKVGCVDSDTDGINDDLDECADVYSPAQTPIPLTSFLCDRPCVDLDGMNPVNGVDFSMLAVNWRRSVPILLGDFNGDGIVDEKDLGLLGEHWLSDCFE